MKTKIFLTLLLVPYLVFAQQTWRPLGDDDFNRASLGSASELGRHPLIIKNGNVFFLKKENADYYETHSFVSMSKFANGLWSHYLMPHTFGGTPIADGAVDDNEVPYVFLGAAPEDNLPRVEKYENGSWTNVGSGISSAASPTANINIGSDNLPWILYREANVIKLKKFDGIQWTLVSQTTEFVPYTSISLALDHNDVPYVVSEYQVGTTYNTFVRKFNETAWEEVGITGFAESGKSLTFDASNIPHMFLATQIKKFDGSSWVNIATPLTAPSGKYITETHHLFFNQNNEMFASGTANLFFGGNLSNFVRKLSGNTWQDVYSDVFWPDETFVVSGDDVYHVSFSTDIYPDIFKKTNGLTQKLGGSTFSTGNRYPHDFRICNGIPMLAYLNSGSHAAVRMYTNGDWNLLGGASISENEVDMVRLASGIDGQIYVAYNNKLSSASGDTKITVKKLTSWGWQAVGPVNFSLSAGTEFDFKIGHDNQLYVFYNSGRLQTYDGSQWNFVGGSAFTGDALPRFVLDASNLPYVAFRDFSNGGHIAVKKRNGNIWEYVDQAGLAIYTGQQYKPRLTIDANNTIYLGFSDSSGDIHVQRLVNGVWEPVGSLIDAMDVTQFELAIDHDNVLHMISNEVTNGFRRNVKVRKYNGPGWTIIGTPDFAAGVVFSNNLAFWENNTTMFTNGEAWDEMPEPTSTQLPFSYFLTCGRPSSGDDPKNRYSVSSSATANSATGENCGKMGG